MNLFVNLKQLGKRKAAVETLPLELPRVPQTGRELIELVVGACVTQFQQRTEAGEIMSYMTETQIEDGAAAGKIAWGVDYNGAEVDLDAAIQNALQCFEDGIFRVFVGEGEITALELPLTLEEDSILTFVRLTMLAGRMW